MNLHLEFSELQVFVNVFFRVITAIIFIAYILPLMIREAGVKNGLKKLRIELLVSGFIIFFVNTAGLSIIVWRYLYGNEGLQSFTDIIALANTFGFLVIAVLKYTIYHQRYTPEQKELHEKLEKIEQKELQKLHKKHKIKKVV